MVVGALSVLWPAIPESKVRTVSCSSNKINQSQSPKHKKIDFWCNSPRKNGFHKKITKINYFLPILDAVAKILLIINSKDPTQKLGFRESSEFGRYTSHSPPHCPMWHPYMATLSAVVWLNPFAPIFGLVCNCSSATLQYAEQAGGGGWQCASSNPLTTFALVCVSVQVLKRPLPFHALCFCHAPILVYW